MVRGNVSEPGPTWVQLVIPDLCSVDVGLVVAKATDKQDSIYNTLGNVELSTEYVQLGLQGEGGRDPFWAPFRGDEASVEGR